MWYQRTPHWQIVFIPLTLVPLLLLTFGLGFIFSLMNAIMRDVANALSMLMTFLMFLTPVLYAKPHAGLLARVTVFNPLYYLVCAPRDLALKGTFLEPGGFALSAVFSLGVFVVCLIVFHVTETRITERV